MTIEEYKKAHEEEIRMFFLVNDFRKSDNTKTTPILDSLKKQGIDTVLLKNFLDRFSSVLIHGTAFEAFELQRSNVFPQIQSTAEALNQGQNCLSGFLKRLYTEYKSEGKQKTEIPDEPTEGIETL